MAKMTHYKDAGTIIRDTDRIQSQINTLKLKMEQTHAESVRTKGLNQALVAWTQRWLEQMPPGAAEELDAILGQWGA